MITNRNSLNGWNDRNFLPNGGVWVNYFGDRRFVGRVETVAQAIGIASVKSLLAEYAGGEFLEAGNGHVGPSVCRSDGADAWACGRAVHPHCR
jgi:hypothetical protein